MKSRFIYLVAAVLVACATPVSAPTEAPAPGQPDLDTPVAPPDYIGARLGGSAAAWTAAYGLPESRPPFYVYPPRVEVTWVTDGSGMPRVETIHLFLPNPALPAAEAREVSEQFMPDDSRLLETYVSDAGQVIEVFVSPKLASMVAGMSARHRERYETGFHDKEPLQPGTFVRVAERIGVPITSPIVLALGDNP
jgi:hypothetical protein